MCIRDRRLLLHLVRPAAAIRRLMPGGGSHRRVLLTIRGFLRHAGAPPGHGPKCALSSLANDLLNRT
eukprot:3206357-Alexandrium_andersonii.AAC.1